MSANISQANLNKYEKEFLIFLTKRIQNVGGSIQFQHITGHLSQVRNEVKNAVVSNKTDLFEFIKKHKNIFEMNNDTVTLANYSQNDGYDSDIEPKSTLPKTIKEGSGVIVKLFPGFGFIKVKEPLKSSVYFKARAFSYDKEVNLTECGLNIGTMVYFNANKQNKEGFTSSYVAYKVWKVEQVDEKCNPNIPKSRKNQDTGLYDPVNLEGEGVAYKAWKVDQVDKKCNPNIPKLRKNRDTGLYDPVNLDGEGVIQRVFPNLGFIVVDNHENNTVFFYKNRVVNYNNIIDLTKIFVKGDKVEFSAHRSTKPDATARWEAIKVWKKSGKSASVKEIEKAASYKSDSGIISNQSSSESRSVENTIHSMMDVKYKSSQKDMIKNQSGKICPRSDGAVIKFGENFTELADGDSSVYYISGTQVTEISWEFSEGDKVQFDAVKIKSAPGWKAVLVWTGDKPDIVLPTCLGDFSEFTDEEDVDEIPESNSETSASDNYLSISSNSSIKSESNAVKSISLDKKNIKSADYTECKKINKKEKLHDADTLSQYGSQSSLSSKDSKNFKKLSKNIGKKTSINGVSNAEYMLHQNSGDTSYPIEEDCKSKSVKYMSDITPTELSQNNVIHIQDEELQSMTDYLNNSDKDSPRKKITTTQVDNFSKSVELKINSDTKIIEANSKSKFIDAKKPASIKKFQGVEGKTVKVYSTFAEVESSKLQKPVAFFWRIFYYDKVSIEELEVDDLKQVLKVGDTIRFNYFEIVDDSGQPWKKVTLAWTGPKPSRFTEITPDDFIKQNDLLVTIENDSNIHTMEKEVTSNKFLTAFDDISLDEKIGDNVSRTESCSDDETCSLKQSKSLKIQVKTLAAAQFQALSSIINQKMLKNKDLFLTDSKADLTTLSAEIINLVLEQCSDERNDNHVIKTFAKENDEKEIPDVLCSSCRSKITDNISSEGKNTKDTAMQTIFTGEVMAQNIFPEC